MPTWLIWFSTAEGVLLALVSLFMYSIRLSFKGGVRIADFDHQGRRIAEVERRIDHGTTKISDLADQVQTMPDRIRAECASRRELEMVIAEHRHDRDYIRQQVQSLWAILQPGRKP